MDRLHAVRTAFATLLAVGCLACDEGAAAGSAPPPGRFEAVTAKAAPAAQTAELEAFCDVRGEAASARDFTPPATEPAGAPLQGEAWINLWATWCKPCLEELPRLVAWHKELEAQGTGFELRFVSADADAQTLADFRQAHPELPESTRLLTAESAGAYVQALGLDAGAGLPVHAFVHGGKLTCVRSGAVLDDHRPLIDRLFGR
jgi:thiol-disulfide isomerase/thioredoxin